jgi:putative mRNA 3-end processing factor
MSEDPIIVNTDRGLYCPAGDFHIDAWCGVPRTIITHAHSDHARPGSSRYLTTSDGIHVLRRRMGEDATIDALEYGKSLDMNGVRVSLHPAGHVLGSAQVRLEHHGRIWVITGDYKRQNDPTCRPFELVRCQTLVTECTFGLPIFRWREPQLVIADINQWWGENLAAGRTSVILAYSLGKAQRVLGSVDAGIGPILLHGAVFNMVEAYRQSGVALPAADYASEENAKSNRGRALVICPEWAVGHPWLRKFSPLSLGVASGWMRVRGFRRRAAADRGFVLSDHVDWPALMQTIDETGAEHIVATHGYTEPLAQYLKEQNRDVSIFKTRFKDYGEEDEAGEEAN